MAGYSRELKSLVRVYPLPVQNPIRVRHRCILDLERNPRDSRRESWKLRGRYRGIINVSDGPAIRAKDISSVLEPFLARSLVELNDKRLSLGVLRIMDGAQGVFRDREVDCDFGAGAFDIAPYIHFRDEDGKPHKLQIRDWGCYEWMRKHRSDPGRLWSNLGLHSGNPIWALVGNMCNRRNVWLIIKTFAVAPVIQRSLFEASLTSG